ncbi:MAG: peroxide stress protein YaaA [Saprospiraceae bacterium]|nr:peroxide stress protein YaaA [Saprospiraceae bacterium]
MLIVISPSKDLDFKKEIPTVSVTQPRFLSQTHAVVEVMKKKSARQLKNLMDISDKLAAENVDRYLKFEIQHQVSNARPAIFAFSGDVYRGLDAYSLGEQEINYCHQHLRILSGLYGLLRPLDLIQPYRLEMGIGLKIGKFKNLYQFWKGIIGKQLQNDLEKSGYNYLINLASQEYFQAIHLPDLKYPVINIHFREERNGKLSFVSFNAKKARGLMARYLADQHCTNALQIKEFNLENYGYNEKLSDEFDWFFTR